MAYGSIQQYRLKTAKRQRAFQLYQLVKATLNFADADTIKINPHVPLLHNFVKLNLCEALDNNSLDGVCDSIFAKVWLKDTKAFIDFDIT